jgi:hypothetical protein
LSRNLILKELAGIYTTICKFQNTVTIFFTVFISSFIACTIRPCLDTLSVLLVLLPVSLVPGSVEVRVNTVTMSLVILPEAVIYVSIGVDETTFAVCLVILGPALGFLPFYSLGLPKVGDSLKDLLLLRKRDDIERESKEEHVPFLPSALPKEVTSADDS